MESISVPYRIESYHDKVNELLAMDDNMINDGSSDATIINLELKPCPICTRTFVPDTLKKHVAICEKMAQKKRKIFDSSRQRREGTELANYLPKGFGLPENKKQCHHQPQQIYQKQHHQSLESNIQNHHLQKKRNSSSESEQTSNNVLGPIKQNDNLQIPVKELPSICTLTSTSTLQPKRSTISSVVGTAVSPVTTCKIPTAESKQKSIERKRNLLPPSEPCPYCERCFGVKAYDRHVEWCKEKARLLENKKNTTKTPAKERLEARIRYRAPCLKSKRAANREKYSGLPCDDSISLIDGYSEKSGSSDPRKFGMSASLSSSIMSDSGLSDKYDPFLSAKRQLEELCSPTTTEPSITPTTPNAPNTPKTPKTTKLSSSYTTATTTPTSNTMTNTSNNTASNFRRTSSLRVSRKKTTPSYSHHPSSRPLFCQSKERPTIQRGISDEGPISSSFLKPEEYDEMPVKSACVNDLAISAQHHHHHHQNSNSPKIIKRDINSSINRRNLRLNINNNKPISNSKDKITSNVVGSSSSIINPISKTDSLAIFLKYENDTKNSSTSIDKKLSLSPSSSLSIKLTEKDLKDKTNTTLSKNQTLSSSTCTPSNKLLPAINSIDCSKMNFNNADNTKNSDNNINNNNNNRFKEISTVMTINKIHPIKLEPLPKNIISLNSINLQNENGNNDNNNRNMINTNTTNTNSTQSKSLNLNSILLDTTKDTTDFIDPKLINVCDNLPINITKFSDSDQTSTSSTDSVSTTKYANLEAMTMSSIIQTNQQINQLHLQQKQQQQQHQPLSVINRNSSEKRNLLKRQLRLGKNQFLYDISPDDDDNDDNCVVIDTYSDHLDKTISLIDTSTDNDPDNNTKRIINRRRNNGENNDNQIINTDEPPTFDDFDFEEFLSSFDENDEQQYPIFKDYKQFLLMNRSMNKQQQQQTQQCTQNQQQQLQKQSSNNNNDNIINSSNRSKLNEMIPIHKSDIDNKDKDNEADDGDGDDEEEFCDNDDIDLESRKNEIFISIETNQTSDDNDVILIDGGSSSSSPLIPLNSTHDSNQNTNDNMENNLCKMNKDEKSDKKINNNFNDMNRNKTKTFDKNDEMIDNEENIKECQEQQQQQQRRQQKQSSENNMLFQLQDSDEICSSIDENFSIHEHNNSLRSKQNADSAYGSLSRHSPIDSQLKRNSSRTRLQSAPTSNKKSMTTNDQQLLATSPTLLHTKYAKSTTWNEKNNNNSRTISNRSSSSGSNNNNNNSNKHRSRNFSASSSGSSSDNSLPLLTLGSVSSETQLMIGIKDEKLLHQQQNRDNDNEHDNHNQPIIRKRTQSIESKMSKFCHECGSKFIVTQAKFCMECGVKRIIIE